MHILSRESSTNTGDDRRNGELFPNLEEIRAAAARYTEEGYEVHRINPDKDTGLPTKAPTYGSDKQRTSWKYVTHEPDDFRLGDNIGAKLGAMSGDIVVADMDSLESTLMARRILPNTRTIGHHDKPTHYHYRSKVPKKVEWKLPGEGKFVELLTNGQQVVMPPSVWTPEKDDDIRTQDHYRTIHDRPPVELEPEELTRMLNLVAGAAYIFRYLPPAGVGMRHDMSLSIAGIMAHYGYSQDDAETMLGAVWTEADGDVRTLMSNIGTTYAAERPEREDKLRSLEVDPTTPNSHALPSGFAANLAKLLRIKLERETRGRRHSAPSIDEDVLRDRVLASERRFALSKLDLREYQDGVWQVAKPRALRAFVADVLADAKGEGARVTDSAVRSVTNLVMDRIEVEPDLWDHNKDAVILKDHVLDLNTYETREYCPQDYATSKLPFNYEADAKAPMWEWFMKDRFDEDVRLFLQEYFGYILTVDCSHEIAVWLVGEPGTGKGTVLEAAQLLAGESAMKMTSRNLTSPFGFGNLRGKRLIVSGEQPGHYTDAMLEMVNQVIEGATVPAEKKGKDPEDVRSTAKLLWSMTTRPVIRDPENGIWRRIKVVEVPPLPEDCPVDPAVKATILTEGPGILAWAVEGLKRLRKRGGFIIPESVRGATEQYAETQDLAAMFLADRCGRDEDSWVSSAELYRAYALWCEGFGYKAKGETTIGADWARLGLEKKNKKRRVQGKKQRQSVRGWQGVYIVDPSTDLGPKWDYTEDRDNLEDEEEHQDPVGDDDFNLQQEAASEPEPEEEPEDSFATFLCGLYLKDPSRLFWSADEQRDLLTRTRGVAPAANSMLRIQWDAEKLLRKRLPALGRVVDFIDVCCERSGTSDADLLYEAYLTWECEAVEVEKGPFFYHLHGLGFVRLFSQGGAVSIIEGLSLQ